MKIYTKSGDAGETGLYGPERVLKSDLRIRALGEVDELNAALGLVLCVDVPVLIATTVAEVQSRLFDLGAEIATTDPARRKTTVPPGLVPRLEKEMDAMTETLPELRAFILPGGSESAARLHMARTVCRRAERRIVELNHAGPEDQSQVSAELATFLNRLSDWLFTAARYANHQLGIADISWVPYGHVNEPS